MKLLRLWLEVHGVCADVEGIGNVLQLWWSRISDGTQVKSESLSGCYFTNLLFQRIHCSSALTSPRGESKLDLKIQIPSHQDPDFIMALYRKSAVNLAVLENKAVIFGFLLSVFWGLIY